MKTLFLILLQAMCLHYDKPATCFEEALPLGNGMQGMMVYGGIDKERISLNDITLWTGEPTITNNAETTAPTPEATTRMAETSEQMAAIREMLAHDDYVAANEMAGYIRGQNAAMYQPLGTLWLEDLNVDGGFNHNANGSTSNADDGTYKTTGSQSNSVGGDYYRDLCIDSAIAHVNYTTPKGGFTQRTYYASYPDSVCVINLQSEKDMHYRVSLTTILPHNYVTDKKQLKARGYAAGKLPRAMLAMDGYAAYATQPQIFGDDFEIFHYDPNRGVHFRSQMAVVAPKKCVRVLNDSTLEIRGCKQATIYLASATSYNGPYANPVTQGRDYKAAVARLIGRLSVIGYNEHIISHRHWTDYNRLFSAFSLDLGTTPKAVQDLPTDVQLVQYKDREVFNPDLEETFFQYGRYLLISSSRTKGVPCSRVGLWNEDITGMKDLYAIDHNFQSNYWIAEQTGLGSLHENTLCEWIMQLPENGRISARDYFASGGWCAAGNGDIWCTTNPVSMGNGVSLWSMGGALLTTHLWEHYANSSDDAFLKRAFPIMQSAAEYVISNLVEKEEYLVISPSFSPSNYISYDGYMGSVCYGATSDMAIAREVLTDVRMAAEILGKMQYAEDIQPYIDRLLPYRTAPDGGLQEWYHEWLEWDGNDHMMHLYGLYPWHQVSYEETPEYADASQASLDMREMVAVDENAGWRICMWARLGRGENAYRVLRQMLTESVCPNMMNGRSTFIMNGNLSASAGMLEMLQKAENTPSRWQGAKTTNDAAEY